MIIDKIENIEKYSQIPISVIKFIKNLTPETPVGHYELENGIFAKAKEAKRLQITAEAKEKIEKLDLSRKEYFGESYKNSIASIMKAKAQVIKKENKKTEIKSVKKDIVTKVENEAKSNIE